MTRHEWFAGVCSAMLQSLPAEAAHALRSLPDLETPEDPWQTPDLGPAVAAAEIMRRYAAGEHPDDIAAWCDRAGFEPGPGTVTTLIVPLCERYRMGSLPWPRWWRPDEVTATLLRWYVRARAAARGIERMVPELLHRWDLSDDEATEVLVNATADIVEAPRIFVDRGHDPASRWLHKVAASKEFRTKVDAALAQYSAALHDRDDLLAMVRYRETHNAIAERLNAASGWRDPVVDTAVERLEAALEASGTVLLSLSPYERRLLEPEGQLESLFARAMEIRHRTFTIDVSGHANPLPDRVDGVWQTTQWLEDYVYHQGGRIMRRSAGPIAHWTIVLEDMGEALAVAELLEDPTYIPGGGFAETSALAEFHLKLADDPSDPLTAEFVYDDTPDGLLDLVVLVQTRRVRLDVFVLRDGALAGVGSRILGMPTAALARILDRLEPAVEALLAQTEASEQARLGLDRADIWARVAAIDAAKSTELLAALDPELIVGVARVDAKRREAYRAARGALLDALAARASGAVASGDAPVEDARTRYARTVEQLRAARPARSKPQRRDDKARVGALVDGLVDDRRAVLTLTLTRSPHDGSTRLGGFWVSGAGRARAAGEVADSAVSLEQLQATTRLPLEGPSDLDALLEAAPTLGRDLVAPLLERGVRELTVVPISFIHALPLHLWPATGDPDGPRLCDVFDSFAYAPSLALLQQLSRQPARADAPAVAAVHGADLAFAGAEARVLSILGGDRTRVLPSVTKKALATEAAGAGLLHLACHGSWVIGDYWRSGLALDGASEANQWLSVAEIQNTLALRGTALVCLSSCESGVSASDIWRVDDYLGIDGAFLACGARAVVSTLWSVADLVSLLFTATMYHALSTGVSLAQAHRAAVSMFTSGDYRRLDHEHPVGALLERAGIDWPQELRDLDEAGDELRHPFYWGVFKLSGLVAEPVHALRCDKDGGAARAPSM
jgi:CHAT domain-containing protein